MVGPGCRLSAYATTVPRPCPCASHYVCKACARILIFRGTGSLGRKGVDLMFTAARANIQIAKQKSSPYPLDPGIVHQSCRA